MKRQFLLFIAMMLSVVTSASESVEVEIDALYYQVFYNEYSGMYEAFVVSGNNYYSGHNSYSGDIVIPETVEYEGTSYTVREISSYAFAGSLVTSVKIPSSVTGIGYKAFHDCKFLTSISGGNNLVNIGDEAFWGCSSLSSADILTHVKQIGSSAFYDCGSLTSVTIGKDIYRIGYSAFHNCGGMTSVYIGRGVKFMGSYAFGNCKSLTDIYCSAVDLPTTESDTFYGLTLGNITLHVPEASVNAYKAEVPWNEFKAVVALNGEIPEVPKCAMPTISYANGKLSFDSETEGVKFVTEITDGDIKKHYDAEIQLMVTYSISVCATKEDYDDSDAATATLCWIDEAPKTEDVTNSIAKVQAKAVLIQTHGGTLTVQGAADGTRVSVYGTNGVLAGSAISNNGLATVNNNLQPGSIAIVKIGEKSVKIDVK